MLRRNEYSNGDLGTSKSCWCQHLRPKLCRFWDSSFCSSFSGACYHPWRQISRFRSILLPPSHTSTRVTSFLFIQLQLQTHIHSFIFNNVLCEFTCLIAVEVCLKSSSTARIDDVQSAVEKYTLVSSFFFAFYYLFNY